MRVSTGSQALAHQPVLFNEVLEALRIRPDGVYVDGTYGRGGHAGAILERLNEQGKLIVMDKDPQAVADAENRFSNDQRVIIIHDDYLRMRDYVQANGLLDAVDGVLLDLGVSSPQLDDATRGFSFQHNGPLDMRMNNAQGETAAEWLMKATEKEIADVLWQLGEERFSRRIARRIVEFRQQQVITDTATLAVIISDCVPAGKEKKHPATRSFQAIRMKINHELEHISQLLEQMFDILKVGGRLLVISFHSLEDRLVKRFIKKHASPPPAPRGLPLREQDRVLGIRLKAIGKAVKADAQELLRNPRSRSAVLRVAERIS